MAPGQNQADVTITVQTVLLDTVNKVNAQLKTALGSYGNGAEGAAKQVIKLNNELTGLNKQLMPKTTPFAGWAMSIMFFGMALQKMFDTLWKSSTKTFNDVMHSVEGTVTQFDILEGSMKYLQFSVGQALEPIVAMLLPIVDAITEWIIANPKLVADIVTAGAILGALFAVGGAGMLAFNGFKDLITIIGAVPTSIKDLGKADWSGFKIGIEKAIGTVALGVGLFTMGSAIKNFFDDDKEGSLKNGLKLVGGILETVGGIKMIKGEKGAFLMIAVGLVLDEVSQGKFFRHVEKLGAITFAILAASFEMLGTVLINVLISPITLILSLIQGAYEGLGKSAPKWVNSALSNLEENTKQGMSFGQNFEQYYQGARTGWGSELDTKLNDILTPTETKESNFTLNYNPTYYRDRDAQQDNDELMRVIAAAQANR